MIVVFHPVPVPALFRRGSLRWRRAGTGSASGRAGWLGPGGRSWRV